MLKWSRYEAAGCPSYWVIDPDEPSVTAWELQDEAYVVAAQASGDQRVALTRPFPVTVVPRHLLD